MASAKKITLFVPEELLKKARKTTGLGITPTVTRGLEILAASRVYEEIRRLRGKVRFAVDIRKLREDRR